MEYSIKYNEKKIDLFFVIILCFLFSSLSGIGRLTNFISAGLLFFIIPNGMKMISNSEKKSFFSLLVFFVFYFITSFSNYSSLYYLIGTSILYTLVTYGSYFIYLYITTQKDEKYRNKLLKYMCIIWFIIVIVAIFTYQNSDDGGRDFVNTHRGNLLGGGYTATYASALLTVLFFNYFMYYSYKTKIRRLLLMIGMFLSFAHVYYTQSVITIVAVIFGIFSSFFIHGSKEKKIGYATWISVLILCVLVFLFILKIEDIGRWMIDFGKKIENDIFSERITEMGRFLYNQDESHHVEKRFYTLSTSIKTFIENPLFGIGYKYGNDYTLLYQNGVGVHSELLDSFAKYGLIGAIPLLLFLIFQFKKIAKITKTKILFPLMCSFVILFTFNPFLSVQTIFTICLFIPLLLIKIEKEIK